MVEILTGHRKGKKMENAYKLSDTSIAQIVKLIQMGILTGTDVVDQLRTFELCVSNGKLAPTPEFLENFEKNISKMLQDIPETSTEDEN